MNTTSSSNDAALISPLCEALEPSGRIVFPGHDPSDWTTWGCSPIDGPDGKVHLFCSHWRNPNGRPRNYAQGWQTASEIWHCVGDVIVARAGWDGAFGPPPGCPTRPQALDAFQHAASSDPPLRRRRGRR